MENCLFILGQSLSVSEQVEFFMLVLFHLVQLSVGAKSH
jgi:hypothetical protein